MTTWIPLGLISLILGFLITIMSGFADVTDTSTTTPTTPAEAGSFGQDAEEMATKFLGGYTSVIDGMLALQENPDYETAEAARQEMVVYAQSLIPQFQGLASELEQKLDDLTIQD